jgi:hypothetical protein
VIALESQADGSYEAAQRGVQSITMWMLNLYHLDGSLGEPLCVYAHAMRGCIEDPAVRKAASLNR